MTLGIDTITHTVSTLMQEHGRGLDLVSVASTEAGSGRVELLITVAGCHREPCRLLLNVTRADPAAFERELRSKLAQALTAHRQG